MQRDASPGRSGPLPAHMRNLTQQASISANIDLIAKLRRQLEERDAEIAELKVTSCPSLLALQTVPTQH